MNSPCRWGEAGEAGGSRTSAAHKLAFSSHYASAVSKLPSLEAGRAVEGAGLGGSKSVPGSLDRKAARAGGEYSGAVQYSRPGLDKSVSSERLQAGTGERPALPVKRSKSMKSVKPVSVIPVLEGSFCLTRGGEDDSPYNTFSGSGKPQQQQQPDTSELIDLTGRPRQSPSQVEAAPPKPRRDWSSLECGPEPLHSSTPAKPSFEFPSPDSGAGEARRGGSGGGAGEPAGLDRDAVQRQLREFVSRSGGGAQHAKQSSGDSAESREEFLENKMAQLLARKVSGGEEVGAGSMPRSRSGELLGRPEPRPLARSVSGEAGRAGRGRSGAELTQDEDVRRMLRDCQEYLQGALDGGQGGGRAASTHSSPGTAATSSSGNLSPAR